MNTLNENDRRDHEIFKELKQLYKSELERADRLNDKAIGLVSSSGVVSALYVGMGTFALERISRENPYYFYLIFFLILGLLFLVVTIGFGLSAYSLSSYRGTNPHQFIEEYKDRKWIELIRYYGGDIANATVANRVENDKKVAGIRLATISLTIGAFAIIAFVVATVFSLFGL